jgi:hypothetical protein
LVGVLALTLGACSVGGDSDDPTSTAATTVESGGTSTSAATGTAERPAETATSEASPTSSVRPSPTIRATPTASPTITPSPSPTVEVVESPFGGVVRPEDALENFTVSYAAEFTGGGAPEDGTTNLLIEQSAPDAYHMLIQNTGGGANLTCPPPGERRGVRLSSRPSRSSVIA